MRKLTVLMILVLLGLAFTGTALAAPASDWGVTYYNDPAQGSGQWPGYNPGQVYCTGSVQGTAFSVSYPGGNPPCTNVQDQTWGAKMTQVVHFTAGDYVFRSNSDDGLKVYLGDHNIIDESNPQLNRQACPPIHLDGDVTMTVIHTNTGGDAFLNLWWDTNSTTCNQPPAGKMNLWVWRDSSTNTRVTNEAGDRPNVKIAYGAHLEDRSDLWYNIDAGRTEMVVPDNATSFLVERDSNIVIGTNDGVEWYLGSDHHWIVRKFLTISVVNGQTRLIYTHADLRPTIRYWRTNGEQVDTSTLWSQNGENMIAVIPADGKAFVALLWIRPVLDPTAAYFWSLNRDSFVATKLADPRFTNHIYLPNVRR